MFGCHAEARAHIDMGATPHEPKPALASVAAAVAAADKQSWLVMAAFS